MLPSIGPLVIKGSTGPHNVLSLCAAPRRALQARGLVESMTGETSGSYFGSIPRTHFPTCTLVCLLTVKNKERLQRAHLY